MAQILDKTTYIFKGIWTDWSKGNVRGLTLTLRPTTATLLTNSLALFVTLSGGQLWTILRFAVHQLRASPDVEEKVAHRHQQQVVLRNASTDLDIARLMSILAWTS
jgi:hypothetical protein